MPDAPRDNSPTRMPIAILVGIFAVIILAVGAFYLSKRGTPPPEPVVEPQSQTLPGLPEVAKVEYRLPTTLVMDGIAEESTEPLLEFESSAGEIVLWVKVTWELEIDKKYHIIVNDSAHEGMYQVWIPPAYLEKGDVPLRLNGSHFEVGQYFIEVTSEGADSVSMHIAEGSFRITE